MSRSALENLVSDPGSPATTPTSTTDSAIHTCSICAQLGHILPCCTSMQTPCQTCTAFSSLLTSRLTTQHQLDCDARENAPDHHHQEEENHIQSLKQQTQEAEEEDKRLSRILEERKVTLRRLQAEKKAREPMVEFTIKEVKRGRKGKRKG